MIVSEFVESDIFRITVPLDEKYSFDFGQNGLTNQSDQSDQSNQMQLSEDELREFMRFREKKAKEKLMN